MKQRAFTLPHQRPGTETKSSSPFETTAGWGLPTTWGGSLIGEGRVYGRETHFQGPHGWHRLIGRAWSMPTWPKLKQWADIMGGRGPSNKQALCQEGFVGNWHLEWHPEANGQEVQSTLGQLEFLGSLQGQLVAGASCSSQAVQTGREPAGWGRLA